MTLAARSLALCAGVALPLAASAQTASAYTPPKLVTPGNNTSTTAGKGEVTVQVYVKKDGSFSVIKVIKSTNPGDDAAALEIAKTAKYQPAMRDGQAVDAYYDYALSFREDQSAAADPVAAAYASIRAGKYDQAKAQLQSYLQAHPADAQGYTLLGVADAFGGDTAGAAAAFERAGSIPDAYKLLASQAYEKNAETLIVAKKYDQAIAAAGRAIELNASSLQGFYLRGIADSNAQNDAAAIADLQKAHALAGAAKVDDKTMATVGYSLAIAQLDAGQLGDAATTAREVVRLDPSRQAQLNNAVLATVKNAAIASANGGKIDAAVGRLEAGAAAFPSVAGPLTAEAAFIMATAKAPDWSKVRAEADKALALDPSDGRADYVAGVAAAHQNDLKSALGYMNKAKSSPTYAADASLAKQIDDALKTLNAAGK